MKRCSNFALLKITLLAIAIGGLWILDYQFNFISELIIGDELAAIELHNPTGEIKLPISKSTVASSQRFDIKSMVTQTKTPFTGISEYDQLTNEVEKQLEYDDNLSFAKSIKTINEVNEKFKTHHMKPGKKEEQARKSFERMGAEERIAARMKRINTLCEDQTYPNFHNFNFYFFKDFGPKGITWCPVFKAGSSTWRDFFIDHLVEPEATVQNEHYHLGLLSQFDVGHTYTYTERITPVESKYRNYQRETNGSVRFTVVRHPLFRLISHLHKAQNYPYEVKRQRKMWTEEAIVNARTNSWWDDETKTKYRQELTQYVDELEPVVDHTPYSKDNPYLHPPYPTFVEMIDFMIKHREPRVDNQGANGHWRPAVEWCDICQNNFDIIIKLEEEPDELMVLLEKLNMLEYKDDFMKRHNSSNKKSLSENEELENYIKFLDEKQIKFLNKMYERDFEILGYEPIQSQGYPS
ncbi:uncharacterized protein LOC134813091 [Bolinopsis microptera]|uniref:uncharacterized protein LOC134813091 n=1 Tax=Bolinopsis microptera TaxID=2820187 RepID=UPI00307ADA9C